MIAALFGFLAFGNSACAPRWAATGLEQGAPRIEMRDGEPRFITRDGLALGLNEWEAKNPKAVIVALHGMADYAHAFSLPAPWFADHDISFYAYDQRGFGRSPDRGVWAGEEALRQDVTDFVDVVRRKHPGLPVFVMGESMGGAVAMTAFAANDPPRADGLILIAPAVWGADSLPFSYRTALWISAHIAPFWELTGSGLHIWPTDNMAVLRDMSRDPLMIKSTRTDAIYGLVQLMDDAYTNASRITQTPVLLCYGDKDQIIPSAATKYVEHVLVAADSNVKVKSYAYGYHLLLRDLSGPQVWADIAAWIGNVAPQRVSENIQNMRGSVAASAY